MPPPLGAKGLGWQRWIIGSFMGDQSGLDFRLDSKLIVIRRGFGMREPEVSYFLCEQDQVRLIRKIPGRPLGKDPLSQ